MYASPMVWTTPYHVWSPPPPPPVMPPGLEITLTSPAPAMTSGTLDRVLHRTIQYPESNTRSRPELNSFSPSPMRRASPLPATYDGKSNCGSATSSHPPLPYHVAMSPSANIPHFLLIPNSIQSRYTSGSSLSSSSDVRFLSNCAKLSPEDERCASSAGRLDLATLSSSHFSINDVHAHRPGKSFPETRAALDPFQPRSDMASEFDATPSANREMTSSPGSVTIHHTVRRPRTSVAKIVAPQSDRTSGSESDYGTHSVVASDDSATASSFRHTHHTRRVSRTGNLQALAPVQSIPDPAFSRVFQPAGPTPQEGGAVPNVVLWGKLLPETSHEMEARSRRTLPAPGLAEANEFDLPGGARLIQLISSEMARTTGRKPDPTRYLILPPGWGSLGTRPKSLSYASLICQALFASHDGLLSLSEIYLWIQSTYPGYDKKDTKWKNSVRHNLSAHREFEKVERDRKLCPGKGAFWTLPSKYHECFVDGIFIATPVSSTDQTHVKKQRRGARSPGESPAQTPLERAKRKAVLSAARASAARDALERASGVSKPQRPFAVRLRCEPLAPMDVPDKRSESRYMVSRQDGKANVEAATEGVSDKSTMETRPCTKTCVEQVVPVAVQPVVPSVTPSPKAKRIRNTHGAPRRPRQTASFRSRAKLARIEISPMSRGSPLAKAVKAACPTSSLSAKLTAVPLVSPKASQTTFSGPQPREAGSSEYKLSHSARRLSDGLVSQAAGLIPRSSRLDMHPTLFELSSSPALSAGLNSKRTITNPMLAAGPNKLGMDSSPSPLPPHWDLLGTSHVGSAGKDNHDPQKDAPQSGSSDAHLNDENTHPRMGPTNTMNSSFNDAQRPYRSQAIVYGSLPSIHREKRKDASEPQRHGRFPILSDLVKQDSTPLYSARAAQAHGLASRSLRPSSSLDASGILAYHTDCAGRDYPTLFNYFTSYQLLPSHHAQSDSGLVSLARVASLALGPTDFALSGYESGMLDTSSALFPVPMPASYSVVAHSDVQLTLIPTGPLLSCNANVALPENTQNLTLAAHHHSLRPLSEPPSLNGVPTSAPENRPLVRERQVSTTGSPEAPATT